MPVQWQIYSRGYESEQCDAVAEAGLPHGVKAKANFTASGRQEYVLVSQFVPKATKASYMKAKSVTTAIHVFVLEVDIPSLGYILQ